MSKAFKMSAITLLLVSCGSYSYKYNRSKNSIIASKGNDIVRIDIIDGAKNDICTFIPVKGKSSNTFSLSDFSPAFFKTESECHFQFKKNETYIFSILPQGDRMIQPLKLKLDTNGKFTNVN